LTAAEKMIGDATAAIAKAKGDQRPDPRRQRPPDQRPCRARPGHAGSHRRADQAGQRLCYMHGRR
jgi:hypothetical protein